MNKTDYRNADLWSMIDFGLSCWLVKKLSVMNLQVIDLIRGSLQIIHLRHRTTKVDLDRDDCA